tara:strand:+ start:1676 stop:2368 length:693 start_codon:yes stop_codon:yes gene_type:complete
LNFKPILDPNFSTIINLFNGNNIPYWICHGTLLGIVRDNKLIEWDHDIDIAVWADVVKKEYITNLMSKANFKLREGFMVKNDIISFNKDGGRIVDINFYKKIKSQTNQREMAYVNWFIPKNILMKLVDAISISDKYNGKFKRLIKFFGFMQKLMLKLKKSLINNNFFYKEAGYTEPLELVQNIKKIKFHGLEIKVPSQAEKYLEYIYGSDWKTPKKNYSWLKDSPSTIIR